MGVVVFDSDVLIGFLNADDAHHEAAVGQMREAMAPGTRRLLCAVNYAEILIGPLKAGRQAVVAEMLERLAIGIVPVDAVLAQHAAAVRARTSLKLPDAFALATALHGGAEATLASFDERVLKTYAGLRPK